MKNSIEINKTFYTFYKGEQLGIYHGERKYLEKIAKRNHTSLHKCLRTELKAIMYWYLHSNEIPKIFDVFSAEPTLSNGFNSYIAIERIDEPGLW